MSEGIPIVALAVSVFVLRKREDACEVLLLKRSGALQGEWCQVAGKLEAGETGWQAALREVGEETGLSPDRFYSADICEQFYEAEKNRISLLPVFVAFVPADATVRLNEEHSDYKWLGYEEALSTLTFAGQRQVLSHVWQEFALRQPSKWLEIPIPHQPSRV